jgi:phosphate-selective porin
MPSNEKLEKICRERRPTSRGVEQREEIVTLIRRSLLHFHGGATRRWLFVCNEGWGAWEIAGRVSAMNLNDQLGTTNGVAGGQQTIYSAGLNWYVNSNIRFMFDYLHGNIAKQVSPTNTADSGAKFDAFAMRTQVAF